jgi:hypothetical protein
LFTKMLQSIFAGEASAHDGAASGEGGIYVTQQEDGPYQALKILKIDGHGVHLRLYSNLFADLPTHIDESKLYLAGIGRKENEPMGMGHVPVSTDSFAAWNAQFVQQSTVSASELEGYELWREADGGYF